MYLHLKGQRELGVLPRRGWLLQFVRGLRGLVGQLPGGFVGLVLPRISLEFLF